jgi:DnaJ-class molecular chaperone
MEDYYKILGVSYDASMEDINKSYNKKLMDYKILPFLSEEDKNKIKELKKAFLVLNNKEYKLTYDKNIKLKLSQETNINRNMPLLNLNLKQPFNSNKKSGFNNSYIANRIFSLNNQNQTSFVTNSELLRPKNVGLSNDSIPEFDIPLDYENTTELQPANLNELTNSSAFNYN